MAANESSVSEDTPLLKRASLSSTSRPPHYTIAYSSGSLPLPLTLSEYSQLLFLEQTSASIATAVPHDDVGIQKPRTRCHRLQSCTYSPTCLLRWGAPAACILFAIVFTMQINLFPQCPSSCSNACANAASQSQHCPFWVRRRRNRYFRYDNGIASYLDLYNTSTIIKEPEQENRMLADASSLFHLGTGSGASLVVAGKLAVEGSPCNIAQMNLETREWSLQQRIQLSLYNSYSGGEVYSLLSNHTETVLSNSNVKQQQNDQGSGELIVVGAFDTTYRNSQVTFCSVGKWDGTQLSKVGEGLCNSALSKGMKITTAAFAGPQDVYVAGSFHTQVWNGDRHEFVKIFNIAHFNAVEQVWLPLNVGQITCSWCTVTVLALAWDSKRQQLHVAGKFNAIDGMNIPAGLAIYDHKSGHLVAHPGGGLSMRNITQDGVGTALQFDEESGVLYVMGSFERLTNTNEICLGLAAYEIEHNRWTCLATMAHTVLPTGGNNMILTPYGLMVAGETGNATTWPGNSRPYTIALLTSTLKKKVVRSTKKVSSDDDSLVDIEPKNITVRAFDWNWLPGFDGHDEPLHALSNGFGDYQGTVFIAGDNLVAMWSYKKSSGGEEVRTNSGRAAASVTSGSSQPVLTASTEILSEGKIFGAVMAISQMMQETEAISKGGAPGSGSGVNYTIIVYCIALGTIIGMFIAIACNRKLTNTIVSLFRKDGQLQGIPLDTLSYSAIEDLNILDAYKRAMAIRYVHTPNPLTLINSKHITLYRIIGEGSFGRVWSAKWGQATVAVKEFRFAQAAVAGKSMQQQQFIDSIIGEAGMMAILRHPHVLQLFGCSLTAQAIWIVSELCSLGSLRQLLDDENRDLSMCERLALALQVAEGMAYLHNQEPPIIHRDLKSHNIFVHETFTSAESTASPRLSESGKSDTSEVASLEESSAGPKASMIVKIGDWGAARASLSRGERTMTHGVGTACWMAPETIKKDRSSKYSDVYSYGIILWEIWTQKEVYEGLAPPQIIHRVANESLRPPVPEDCPWKDLMVRCWSQLPLDRPDFDTIVEELMDHQSESPPWYPALIRWIKGNGGFIHESLVLTNQDGIRGIACRDAIAKDELLIRLPAATALSGESMPSTHGSKHVSSWLKCLAALYQAYKSNDSHYRPYLDSQPSNYEHLFQWTDNEVNEYLRGTTLGTIVKQDRSQNTLEQRFRTSVKPYLIYTGALSSSPSLQDNEKAIAEQFRQLCMVLSTRGFHLQSTSLDNNTDSQQQESYSGPFLLPFIDLLNHNPTRACTTLQRNADDGTFYMIAERNIEKGEEIFHSYGNDLSSAQCLQTFGFVPDESIHRAAGAWNGGVDETNSNGAGEVTPAVLSRDDILSACGEMAESDYPMQVRAQIENHRNGEDESWHVKVDSSRKLDDLISSEIPINYSNTFLPDQLVTLCTLLLLPEDAYNDFMSDSPSLLDSTVLQDYYLGKLVCRSLLTAIDNKKKAYGNNVESDSDRLRQLYNDKKNREGGIAELRAMYGLTVRIEEMTCLERLRRQVLELMDSLDDDGDDGHSDVGGGESGEAIECTGKRKRDGDE